MTALTRTDHDVSRFRPPELLERAHRLLPQRAHADAVGLCRAAARKRVVDLTTPPPTHTHKPPQQRKTNAVNTNANCFKGKGGAPIV